MTVPADEKSLLCLEMTTIVVGYLPTAEGCGRARPRQEVGRRQLGQAADGSTGRNGDYSHPSFASAQDPDAIEAEMAEAG